MWRRIAASRAWTLRDAPRRIRFAVISAKVRAGGRALLRRHRSLLIRVRFSTHDILGNQRAHVTRLRLRR